MERGASWETNSSALSLRLTTNRSEVAVGQSVHMQFTITNTRHQTEVVETKDRPVMDITVDDAASHNTLLSWSSQHPDQVAHRLEWQPGESKTIELTWTATEAQIPMNVFVGEF